MDSFGRKVDYLRISVTDRCNERCLYCMPEGYKGWERTSDHLTATEIIRVVGIAASLGFKKFRLTGGEPLVRTDLPEIIRGMNAIPGVETIGLSTNGTRLASQAKILREAGLRTVNISLDALDPEVYRRVTGGDLASVLAGVRAAVEAGFECIKLNCVLMRGVNENEIWPLVLFAAEHQLALRFIELMPLSRTDVLSEKNFLPVGEVMERLRARDNLIPQPDRHIGNGPAKYYQLEHTGALVGFIGALTNLHFCEACNKMRLTADGKIRPCLGDHGEIDLRTALREAKSDAALAEIFQEALRIKPLEHQFRNSYQPLRPMTAIGG
ncbi:MAG TPA: GTP 3',8-cyclase MoaA [Verrucomicrobiae bacterium]|jgi:cyclic pyranopterin phosphate synthase|nr:GTP 3',8-cyclase MoaA [Verrucomicrobiae bacterium]